MACEAGHSSPIYATTTVKTGGSARPSRKRQKISNGRLGASAIITSGRVDTIIAATITRLRPSTSAMAPANGADSAIANVVAVMVRLTCAGLAANSCASDGSSDCGP